MKPLGARLLCRPVLIEDSYAGGLILATDQRREAAIAQQAEVLIAGRGERDEDGEFVPVDPRLQPGAWVIHTAFARSPMLDIEETFVLHERDIVAILEVE